MNVPRTSVVMPTYNNAHYLGEAVQSVLAQTYSDWELIVVDDGSTDDTAGVVAQFDDVRIRYIYQENAGVSLARNVGIAAARGEYVAFLDADDLYRPEKLAVQIDHLDRHAEVGLNYVSRIEIDEHGQRLNLARLPDEASLQTFVLSFPFAPSDCMVRRVWLDEVGGFRSNFVVNEDRDWYIRLALAGCRCVGIDEFLSFRRLNTAKVHSNLPARMDDMLRALETAFSDQRCPAEVLSLKNEALHNVYSGWAYQAAIQDESDLAQQYWNEAKRYSSSRFADSEQSLIHFWIHATTRDGGDHEARMRQIFDQLPNDMLELLPQRDWAIARGYLLRGIREIMWKRLEQSEPLIERAAALGVEIDTRFMQTLTHYLLSYELAFGRAAARRATRDVISALQVLAAKGTVRKMWGHLLINQAFRQYEQKLYGKVIPSVAQAIRHEPTYLINRGVAAISLRSLSGLLTN